MKKYRIKSIIYSAYKVLPSQISQLFAAKPSKLLLAVLLLVFIVKLLNGRNENILRPNLIVYRKQPNGVRERWMGRISH